jgi:hypothetical protein
MTALDLTFNTTGRIFQIPYCDFIGGVTPTVELPADHPFHRFWLDSRTKIATPLNCDGLIDAYVAVSLKNDWWTEGLSHTELAVHRECIVRVLRDNPPDLLILDRPPQDEYGMHVGQPATWQYIGITKHWVDKWTLAIASSPNRRLALAAEAVLRATLVHEIAHWILTLVSKPFLAKPWYF